MQGIAAEIARLRMRIADIEKRPALGGSAASGPVGGAGLLALPHGTVHEIFSDDIRNAGSALGFALGQARGLVGPGRPALIVLQLVGESGEAGLPYGPGLGQFGIDPDTVTLIRAESLTDLLWALEEAIVCAAVAAVIADLVHPHKALDFTASRRLALRAETAGTSAFLVRYGLSREASAARCRWRVLPASSGPPAYDARAPGGPRFSVTLEKGRLAGIAGDAPLTLDWTTDGFAWVEPDRDRDAAAARRGAAAPRSQPAALGDGLSEAG